MASVFAQAFLRTADGTVRVFLAEALLLPTGLITVAYLTRRLGPEGYGLFVLTVSLVGWIAWSSSALFSRATVKYVSETDDWCPVGTTVLRLHVVLGIIATVLLWATAAPLADLLGAPRLKGYLQIFSFELLLHNVTMAHRQILIGRGLFRQRALGSALHWPVRLGAIVLLVELGLSIPGALAGSLLATLAEFGIYRYYARPSLAGRAAFPPRRLIGFAMPLFLAALCMNAFNNIDLFALKALGGTVAEAGYYGAAVNVSIIPGLFAGALAPLLLSTLGHLLRQEQHEAARRMERDALRLVLGMLPFAGMTAGAASEIVQFLFGPAFAPTAPLLALLIFCKVAVAFFTVATIILVAANRPGWTFALAAPVLLLASAGHVLLIPRFGALGAAWVSTLLAGIGALTVLVAVYIRCRVLPQAGTALRVLVLTGGAYAAAVLFPASGIWLVPKLLLIMAGIGAGFWMLGEFSRAEKQAICVLLRRRLRNLEQ